MSYFQLPSLRLSRMDRGLETLESADRKGRSHVLCAPSISKQSSSVASHGDAFLQTRGTPESFTEGCKKKIKIKKLGSRDTVKRS